MFSNSTPKRVFIFDFDGTIADTYHYVVAISNQLAKEYNYREISEDEKESLKDHSSREVIKILKVPLMKIPAIIARAKQELYKNVPNILPIPELKETLQKIHSLGIPMGILSSNSKQNVHAFLENHNMKHLFKFVETTSKVWSKDSSLKKILHQYQLRANQLVYVGDELRDVAAAHRIKAKVIAVTWGFNSYTALNAHNPDYIISNPSELLDLIQNLQS